MNIFCYYTKEILVIKPLVLINTHSFVASLKMFFFFIIIVRFLIANKTVVNGEEAKMPKMLIK